MAVRLTYVVMTMKGERRRVFYSKPLAESYAQALKEEIHVDKVKIIRCAKGALKEYTWYV